MQPSRSLGETLERIRHTAGFESKTGSRTWFEILDVWEKQYHAFLRGQRELPETSLERLADFLQLPISHLLAGEVDYPRIAQIHDKRGGAFPEKYSIGAFGRRRTTITSLDYIEKHSGWRTRAQCLDRFEVNEGLFVDPMASISMGFITDLCAHLAKHHGYRSRDFFGMGAYSSIGNRNTLLSATYGNARKPGHVYEMMFGELLKYYEQNCSYELTRLDQDSGEVKVASNPWVAEALGVRALGNEQICSLKAGWIASAMDYLGLPFAKVVEIACVHRGDPSCRFQFDFSAAAHAHSKRMLDQ